MRRKSVYSFSNQFSDLFSVQIYRVNSELHRGITSTLLTEHGSRNMLISSTAHPSYCPSAILHIRPTAKSDLRQLFIFVQFEGQLSLREFLGRALRLGRARGRAPRLGQARGLGAAARSPSSSCETTCWQVGWAVGRMGVGLEIHHHCKAQLGR